MEKKKIRDLAKGEYFILNPIEEPNASQVWVRGEYIREAKKYSTYKWGDENDESIAKAYLIDRVKDTRETVIERNIERTIY